MRTFEQFDGSVWRQYESENSFFLLTEVGRRLMVAEKIGHLLRNYADDYFHDRESTDDTRSFLAEGGNARVFSVGDSRLAIKEKRPGGDDLFASLHRMDRLIHAVTVDTDCPRWIGVPQHYGIVMDKSDPTKQFMLMEKIDAGVTVGDIKHYDSEPREPHLKASVEDIYGVPDQEFKEEIIGRYGIVIGELRRALMAKYLSPDRYIPDIDHNPYNVVLEPLAAPVDDSDIKFWIIDQ
jgi:hypothetical protein